MVLSQGKKANVAKTAVARELACFMWGMMTGNIARTGEVHHRAVKVKGAKHRLRRQALDTAIPLL